MSETIKYENLKAMIEFAKRKNLDFQKDFWGNTYILHFLKASDRYQVVAKHEKARIS
jgi:hypothetical protein